MFYPSLMELSYFKDRLLTDPYLEARARGMAPELSKLLDSLCDIDSLTGNHLRDSIRKMWLDSAGKVKWYTNPEIRP